MESFAWRPFDYGQFPAAVGMGPFINPNHAGGFLILIHFWCIHGATKLTGLWRLAGVGGAVISLLLIATSLSLVRRSWLFQSA